MLVKKEQKPGTGKRCTSVRKRSTPSPEKKRSAEEKRNFCDIKALVKSIQRDEGHTDCFRKGAVDCDEPDCKWRTFCLEGSQIFGETKA